MTAALLLAIALGMVVSLLFTERYGLSPGGVIAPGFLASYLQDPWLMGLVAAAALLSVGAVRVLATYVVIEGQRRSALLMMVSFLAALLLASAIPGGLALDGPGALALLVPGLIATRMDRQGVIETTNAVVVVAVLVRLAVLLAGSWFDLGDAL